MYGDLFEGEGERRLYDTVNGVRRKRPIERTYSLIVIRLPDGTYYHVSIPLALHLGPIPSRHGMFGVTLPYPYGRVRGQSGVAR
jgi:hypothetical protein